MYTVLYITEIANICISLVVQAIAKGAEKDIDLPRKILMCTQSVEDYNEEDPTNQYLTSVSNFLYAICGGYAFQAESLYGGTGGLLPSISSGSVFLAPYNIIHTVTAGEAGSSTLSNPSWILLQNMSDVVINNSTYQYNTDFVFNTSSGQFNFSPSGYILQEGDLVTALAFEQVQNNSSSSSAVTYPTTIYPIANDTLNVTVGALVGKTITLFLRGGIGSGELITSGTPTGTQVLFTSATGTFTVAAGNKFIIGEQLTVQFY